MPAAPLWRHLASAQMPVPPRRRLSARARRRRTAAAGLAVFALAVLAASVVGRGGPKDSKQPRVTSTHRTSVPKTNLTTVLQLSTASASLPHPLSRAAAAGDGRGGVVLGGLDTTTHTTGEVLRMAADGTFTPVGTLQVPAHDAAAARIGSSVFVFGGGAQRPSDAVQRFAGSGVAPVVARLPSARADLAAVTVGDRVVLVGGYDGRHGLADVLATRDGLHFAVVARLARPVRYPAVAAVGPRVFVFGGEDGTTPVDDIQAIDLSTGTVRTVGHLPEAVGEASVVTGSGRFWIVGGRTPSGITDAVVRFDVATGTASMEGRRPSPAADSAAVVAGGTTYLLGGEQRSLLDDVVTARVATERSSGPMASPRVTLASRSRRR